MANKFIFLWGPSRSVSTAMQKAFQQRKDTATLFEPFADTYYFSRERFTSMYGLNSEFENRTFNVVAKEILEMTAPIVFMKEMAYFITPYDFSEFISAAENTFIIRDPRLTLASRKKERKDEIGEHEFGFTALKQLWDTVSDRQGRAPILIDGEKLRKDPKGVLESYCASLKIEFMESMLHWQQGPIRAFAPHETASHERWHKTLNASTGFISDDHIGNDLLLSELTANETRMLENAKGIYKSLSPYIL